MPREVLMTLGKQAEDLAWQTLQKCGRRYDPLAYARFMARRRLLRSLWSQAASVLKELLGRA
jgi:hypothetical protein